MQTFLYRRVGIEYLSKQTANSHIRTYNMITPLNAITIFSLTDLIAISPTPPFTTTSHWRPKDFFCEAKHSGPSAKSQNGADCSKSLIIFQCSVLRFGFGFGSVPVWPQHSSRVRSCVCVLFAFVCVPFTYTPSACSLRKRSVTISNAIFDFCFR